MTEDDITAMRPSELNAHVGATSPGPPMAAWKAMLRQPLRQPARGASQHGVM